MIGSVTRPGHSGDGDGCVQEPVFAPRLDLSAARGLLDHNRSSALRRVQSMPVGAPLRRLMRIVWVGVAITLSG